MKFLDKWSTINDVTVEREVVKDFWRHYESLSTNKRNKWKGESQITQNYVTSFRFLKSY